MELEIRAPCNCCLIIRHRRARHACGAGRVHTLVIIIIIVVLFIGGGGWYDRGRWF
jgi:hypothetical protein